MNRLVVTALAGLGAACAGGETGSVDAAAPAGPDAAAGADRRPIDSAQRDLPAAPAFNGPVAPWSARDVGAVSPRGEVRASVGLLTVRAGGADWGGVADGFHFVSQKVRGDLEVVARIRSLQMVDPDSKAGLMIRANDSDSAAAHLCLTVMADPMKGGALQHRAAGGAATATGATDPAIRAGQWLRLVRRGRNVTAYRSANRQGWVRVGSADLDLPLEVAVGVAVAGKNPLAATTVEVDALRVHDLDTQPATQGWMLEELGGVGASALHDGGALAVTGFGETFSLLGESGVFVFQSASGAQTLTARVASFSHGDPVARVGLMVREGPALGFARTQPAVVVSVTAGMGVHFQARAAANTTAGVAPRKPGAAPLWLRLERIEVAGPPLASRFVGSYSNDGTTWTVAGSATFALPEPYLVGVLVSSDGANTPAAVTLTDLALTGGAAPPPPAPDAGTPPDAPPPAEAGADRRPG